MYQPAASFHTLDGLHFARDFYGDISFSAGRHSVVFDVTLGLRRYALKCYLCPTDGFSEVLQFASSVRADYMLPVDFYPHELCIFHGNEPQYIDIALTEWAEGRNLDFEIRRAVQADDRDRLALLADRFDRMACSLLAGCWAHGDLKPENIIVGSDGRMRLIDYDSIYAPSLPDRGHVGTPGFQHPLRSEATYSKHIDDYSIALLSVSLHALACEPELFTRYNFKDNLIMYPSKILCGRDECYEHICRAFSADTPVGRLCGLLASPTPYLEGIEKIMPCTTHR